MSLRFNHYRLQMMLRWAKLVPTLVSANFTLGAIMQRRIQMTLGLRKKIEKDKAAGRDLEEKVNVKTRLPDFLFLFFFFYSSSFTVHFAASVWEPVNSSKEFQRQTEMKEFLQLLLNKWNRRWRVSFKITLCCNNDIICISSFWHQRPITSSRHHLFWSHQICMVNTEVFLFQLATADLQFKWVLTSR